MSGGARVRARGRLVALEGIDGCGKSTQARLLAEALGAELTFEPGATRFGRELRGILLDPHRPAPAARAEALLMVADRAQHVVEVLEPLLAAGHWVVTDRYSGSTLAYQGWGRGLDREQLAQVVAFGTAGVAADLSVLVDVPPAVARDRLGAGAADRLERLDPAFHTSVRRGFLAEAGREPERWAVVDGTGPVDAVAAEVVAAVTGRLGRPEGTRRP